MFLSGYAELAPENDQETLIAKVMRRVADYLAQNAGSHAIHDFLLHCDPEVKAFVGSFSGGWRALRDCYERLFATTEPFTAAQDAILKKRLDDNEGAYRNLEELFSSIHNKTSMQLKDRLKSLKKNRSNVSHFRLATGFARRQNFLRGLFSSLRIPLNHDFWKTVGAPINNPILAQMCGVSTVAPGQVSSASSSSATGTFSASSMTAVAPPAVVASTSAEANEDNTNASEETSSDDSGEERESDSDGESTESYRSIFNIDESILDGADPEDIFYPFAGPHWPPTNNGNNGMFLDVFSNLFKFTSNNTQATTTNPHEAAADQDQNQDDDTEEEAEESPRTRKVRMCLAIQEAQLIEQMEHAANGWRTDSAEGELDPELVQAVRYSGARTQEQIDAAADDFLTGQPGKAFYRKVNAKPYAHDPVFDLRWTPEQLSIIAYYRQFRHGPEMKPPALWTAEGPNHPRFSTAGLRALSRALWTAIEAEEEYESKMLMGRWWSPVGYGPYRPDANGFAFHRSSFERDPLFDQRWTERQLYLIAQSRRVYGATQPFCHPNLLRKPDGSIEQWTPNPKAGISPEASMETLTPDEQSAVRAELAFRTMLESKQLYPTMLFDIIFTRKDGQLETDEECIRLPGME